MKTGWPVKKLGDVCRTGAGGTPLKAKKEYYENGTIPWLMSGEVSQGEVRSATNFITQKGLENSAAKIFPKDTVLVAMYGATAGQVGILKFEAATNQAVCGILPNNHFIPEFLFYLLLSRKDELVAQAAGNAQPNISQIKIRNTDIPIAPLPEQQRIVDILDAAFDGIATAKANAEKNLQNARALFESHLQSVFTQRGEKWVDTKLDDVCGFQNGFAFKSSSFKENGCPILRISNIQDGKVDTDRLVFFDPKDCRENLDRYRIVADDLLIAMSGATTGKLGFNTESTVFYLNQRVGKFEPGKKLNKRFLYHFLSTKVEENLRISAGSAQPNLSTEQIKNFALPLPPIEEQAHIVAALESLSEETQHLTSLYQQKLAALNALKKSLLHQAFSGAL